jgi:hypothetical protein
MRIAPSLLLSLALAGAPAVRAADPDIAALEQEVKALKEVVLDLQKRLGKLESRQSPAAHAGPGTPPAAPLAADPLGANPGYISPEAALRANWSKIAQEMDQAEVMRLLGTPSKKFVLDGRTVWYYYYPATGSGSVFFTDAGKVSSRQSPFGWGW